MVSNNTRKRGRQNSNLWISRFSILSRQPVDSHGWFGGSIRPKDRGSGCPVLEFISAATTDILKKPGPQKPFKRLWFSIESFHPLWTAHDPAKPSSIPFSSRPEAVRGHPMTICPPEATVTGPPRPVPSDQASDVPAPLHIPMGACVDPNLLHSGRTAQLAIQRLWQTQTQMATPQLRIATTFYLCRQFHLIPLP